MGFADYFSKHPTSTALPVSKDDKNFVINLIDSFKFMLKRADKNSSNRIAANIPAQNDAIQTSEQKQTKQTAFSQFCSTKQSFFINPLFVNVCTRNKTKFNTFEQQITKRPRNPNKKNMSSIDHTNTPSDNPKKLQIPFHPPKPLPSAPKQTVYQILDKDWNHWITTLWKTPLTKLLSKTPRITYYTYIKYSANHL